MQKNLISASATRAFVIAFSMLIFIHGNDGFGFGFNMGFWRSLDCGAVSNGSSTNRIMYQSATAADPSICVSETQTATCNSGTLSSYSGTYTNSSCTNSRDRWLAAMATTCNSESQTSACSNGSCGAWSGSYTFTSCTSCSGTVVGGYCWYAAAQGGSCTDACLGHGGTTVGAINYSGWSNGSLANCNAVLTAVGMGSGSTTDNNNARPIGCAINSGNRHRYSSAQTTDAGSGSTSYRVCSCVN